MKPRLRPVYGGDPADSFYAQLTCYSEPLDLRLSRRQRRNFGLPAWNFVM